MVKNYQCTFYKNDESLFTMPCKNKSNDKNILLFDLLGYETKIDIQNEIFTRENDTYIFLLDIKNKYCKIELKKEDICFDVNVEECFITFLEDKILLEYFIETDEARNKLEIERCTSYE